MKNSGKKADIALLRQKAEELLKSKKIITPPELSTSDTLKLIQELEVHQVELEMQNEELILAKERADASTEKYTELYDFAPSGYYTLSKEGRIIELNIMGAQMLGKNRANLIQNRFVSFVSPDSKSIFNIFLEKVFQSRNKESCDLSFSINGKVPIYAQLVGIASENGEKCLLNMVDITDRMQTEAEIKLNNDELAKLNAEKDRLFSIIAHDLRSPFNSFLGLTRLLVEDLESLTLKELQKIALSMRNSANNLYRLLENLLEWSCLQRGLTSFQPESSLLIPIIEESIQLVLEPAAKKDIEIRYEIPKDCRIYADKNMTRSIIRNLLTNALKFTTKNGKITVNTKLTADNATEISIKDTGIGMSKTMVADLFRIDVQTNRKGTEGEPSTGLGLIICKDFIEKHGGKIWAESEEGQGSTFFFTLPGSNHLLISS